MMLTFFFYLLVVLPLVLFALMAFFTGLLKVFEYPITIILTVTGALAYYEYLRVPHLPESALSMAIIGLLLSLRVHYKSRSEQLKPCPITIGATETIAYETCLTHIVTINSFDCELDIYSDGDTPDCAVTTNYNTTSLDELVETGLMPNDDSNWEQSLPVNRHVIIEIEKWAVAHGYRS